MLFTVLIYPTMSPLQRLSPSTLPEGGALARGPNAGPGCRECRVVPDLWVKGTGHVRVKFGYCAGRVGVNKVDKRIIYMSR